MKRINQIRLLQLLPRVFDGEELPVSGVWCSDVSFHRSDLYLVESRSGGGKSSLVSFIYGDRRDFLGKIFFDSTDSASLGVGDWQELRRRHLAYLPQELMLFPELSAFENVQLKNSLTGFKEKKEIRTLLEQLGLADRIDWPAGRLSVGQQQRVAIVRSICQPMDFMLIDEPVSHLDPANNRIAARIIADEAARQGASVISTSVGNPLLLDYNRTLKL